jgi:protein phosphatase
MQACPHCQFQNPDSNKFCQKCGGALADPSLAGVDFIPTAGTFSATVTRYAILSGFAGQAGEAIATAGEFLDEQQRYQLTADITAEAVTAGMTAGGEIDTLVADAQPLQPPILDDFYRQQIGYPSTPVPGQTLTIPTAAQPYLELRKRHPFLPLPKIHDAWEKDGLSVLLLEERSHLPSLLSLWGGQAVLVEIVDWLDEMVELWAALSPQHCCRSLLEFENLRVDEDGLLCLQRLYLDDAAQPSTLQDLGAAWQTLFVQSQRTQRGDLSLLFSDLQTGQIITLDDLRSRIKTIKNAVANPSAAPVLPVLPSPAPAPLLNTHAGAEDGEDEPEDSEDMTRSLGDYSTVAVPLQLVGYEDAGQTDIGCQRNHNEDCFSLESVVKKIESPDGKTLQAEGLYILCDGMGGHAGGEIASALAVETLQQYFAEHWQERLPDADQIRQGICRANRAIFDLNQERASSGSGRMGTTLAMALIQDKTVAIAHVGDSRIYRFSHIKGLEQLTVDHEVGQREIQRGVEAEIAYARPDAYQLTQALGPRDENGIKPAIEFLELNEDMLLLLCSDGLTDNDLLETYWESHLTPMLSGQMSLDVGVNHLIELANQHNGHDNITAIVVRVRLMPMMVPPMAVTQPLPPSSI